MKPCQLSFTQRANAVIAILKLKEELSKEVDVDVDYRQMQLVCFDCIEPLRKVHVGLIKKPYIASDSCDLFDAGQVFICIDRCIRHFTIELSKERQIELFEQGICEKVSKQEVEDVFDLGIDLLNTVLGCLDYRRYEA